MVRCVLAALALAGIAVASVGVSAQSLQERGVALYSSAAPLTGRLRGHAQPLPPAALACANCHESRTLESQAPALDKQGLTTLTSRRGGPPTAYTEQSFCNLLATNVDPARIMMLRAMPTYVLSKDDCAALWAYLSQREAPGR